VDTRRRAACDLVKGLSRYFEPQITSIFGKYIESMLEKFYSNQAQNWKSKDAAIYLVSMLYKPFFHSSLKALAL
jgi:exportin-2 (importin alpha re-exporter)